MSTILTALKKAEQASGERHNAIGSSVGFKSREPGEDTSAQRRQSPKGPWLIAAAGVVGLVLAAVAIYFYGPKDISSLPEKPALPLPAKPIPVQPVATALENNPVPTFKKPRLPQSQAPTAKFTAPVLSHQLFDLKTLPPPVAKKPDPVKDMLTKDALANDSGKTTPVEAAPTSDLESVNIQTLDPEDLTFQAISWSKTPSARVVVINDRVLGEKDTIEGYEIVAINKDEIILSDGSATKFRLVYKNR